MKRTLLSLFLMAALLVPAASAAYSHSHGQEEGLPTYHTADWAKEEVREAWSLGLLPDDLPEDYRSPITRMDFCRMMLSYLAAQWNTDPDTLVDLVNFHRGNHDADGLLVQTFADADAACTAAFHLGLVQGKAPGIFDPDGSLTRQEAAVMLVRAQKSLGFVPPDSIPTADYKDGASIAPWAAESVALLSQWKVMQGTGGNTFSPASSLTLQECAVLSLRLHQKAPMGAGSASPLFSPEESQAYLQNLEAQADRNHAGFRKVLELDGPQATLIRMDWSGTMQATSRLYLLYPDGGLQALDLGLCLRFGMLTPDLLLENPRFSQDGGTFLCEVRLTQDSVYNTSGTPVVTHEKGLYHVSVDLSTRQVTLDRTALPG